MWVGQIRNELIYFFIAGRYDLWYWFWRMDGDLCLMENMQMQKNNTYQNLREYKTFNKYSGRLRFIFCLIQRILNEDIKIPEVTCLCSIRLNNSRSPCVPVPAKDIYCEQGRALPSSATMWGMTTASMAMLKKRKKKKEKMRRRRRRGRRTAGGLTPTLKHKPAWGQAGFTKGQDVVDLYRNHTEEMSANFLSHWHPSVCVCVSLQTPHHYPTSPPSAWGF